MVKHGAVSKRKQNKVNVSKVARITNKGGACIYQASSNNTVAIAVLRYLQQTDPNSSLCLPSRRNRIRLLSKHKRSGVTRKGAVGRVISKKTLRKESLMCTKCRLKLLDWPYCGLTGDQHVLPNENSIVN